MELLMFMFGAVIPVISGSFSVRGPSAPLVAPLGSPVVLPCYVGKHLPMNDLEVEWRRTDSEALVHLYQDGESRPEAQQQDYHDRAHFFTKEIQHGNFSLRLDNLRVKDEGEYTCRVYSQQESGETVVQIKDVERLLVSGSDVSISAFVGEDVTLNCSVDSHIKPEHIEELSWKKMHEDGDILVLLYQNNESLPEAADEQYRDSAEFFTSEIPKGNFSLRLKSVRTEDKGVYICQVFAGGASANATVILERMGFSALHIIMVILCISASGSALLLCYLVHYMSHKTASPATKYVRTAGFLHMFIPNIIMFVAFVLWGVTEGFLYETVSCCALNILRPLMLINVAPFLEKMSGEALSTEVVIYTIFHGLVLCIRAWKVIVHFDEPDKVLILIVGGLAILFFVLGIIYLLTKKKVQCHVEICKWIWDQLAFASCFVFLLAPSLLLFIVFFAFAASIRANFFSMIIPVFYFFSFTCLFKLQGEKSCFELLNKTAWIIYMFIMNTVMVLYHIEVLGEERDGAGWVCMAAFQLVLWMIPIFLFMGKPSELTIIYKTILYAFGSVGVVFVSSVTLMTELILTTVNGERAVGDLRVVIFSSESIFAFSLLIFLVFGSWISDTKCLQYFQGFQTQSVCSIFRMEQKSQQVNRTKNRKQRKNMK